MSRPALWVFGYGSLVWRPDMPYDEHRPAVITGWIRRFWQGSTDHRGVPGAPGRVVTVLPRPDEVVLGRAFRVPDAAVDEVLAALDHREKGGYERAEVDLHDPAGGAFARGLVYRATPDNPNYLGPAPLDAIARQVVASRGPSGPNPEYVLRLDEALIAMGGIDPHVRDLAEAVRDLLDRGFRPPPATGPGEPTPDGSPDR